MSSRPPRGARWEVVVPGLNGMRVVQAFRNRKMATVWNVIALLEGRVANNAIRKAARPKK